MTLTADDYDILDAASLESMTFELYEAIRNNQPDRYQAVSQRLEDFSTDITVADGLRDQAHKVRKQAALGLAESALRQLETLADSIATSGSGLRNAARAAEAGKEDLFLPALAAQAQRAVTVLKEFKKAAESIEAAVDGRDYTDIKQALDDAKSAYDNLMQAIEAA